MTDFDAIRAVLGGVSSGGRMGLHKGRLAPGDPVEHPEFGMRVCRVSDDIVVNVIYAGEHYTPPVLPHRMAAARRAESASLVH